MTLETTQAGQEFNWRRIRWCLYTGVLWAGLCIPLGGLVVGGRGAAFSREMSLVGGPLLVSDFFATPGLSDTGLLIITALYLLGLAGLIAMPVAYPPERRVRKIVVSLTWLTLIVLLSVWGSFALHRGH